MHYVIFKIIYIGLYILRFNLVVWIIVDKYFPGIIKRPGSKKIKRGSRGTVERHFEIDNIPIIITLPIG